MASIFSRMKKPLPKPVKPPVVYAQPPPANPMQWFGGNLVPNPNIALPAPVKPVATPLQMLVAHMGTPAQAPMQQVIKPAPAPVRPPSIFARLLASLKPTRPATMKAVRLGDLGLIVSGSEGPPEGVRVAMPTATQMVNLIKDGLNTAMAPTQIQYAPPPPPTFMSQYGHVVALAGGVGLGLVAMKLVGGRSAAVAGFAPKRKRNRRRSRR